MFFWGVGGGDGCPNTSLAPEAFSWRQRISCHTSAHQAVPTPPGAGLRRGAACGRLRAMHKMPAMLTVPPKVSFKAQMYQAREAAILASACRLLGEKAFDLMTMDDVANAVGIAKASLYKHFVSKEALCTAAMVQMLGRVQTYLASLPAQTPALEKLHALLRWSLEQLPVNQIPLLPGRHSVLRAVLIDNQDYRTNLPPLSD